MQDELSVLECRASGADTFVINTAVLTIEEIQYLVEVGRDFGMESILSVKSVDDFKKISKNRHRDDYCRRPSCNQ